MLMAKLTAKATKGVSKYTSGKTTNRAGGTAFKLKDEARLMTGVLTTFFSEPKYYGDTDKDIIETARKLVKSNPEFVAKLAAYTRNEFHMRTISQVLAAEVANGAKGNPIVRKMARRVIERPDDMANILSYYLANFKKPIARSLRRGLADAFPRFDEYQLAKYKGLDDDVKLRDVVKLVRPKPQSEEQGLLWKRLIENTLETPETRETILSAKGQSKKVWEDMIDSKKLGYMATLRNLENMLKNKVSDKHVTQVCDFLRNPNAVARSKQLPFRFFSAYKMIEQGVSHHKVGDILDALEDAISTSVQNLPRFDGVTFMTTDTSGSMNSSISRNSIVRCMDIGCLLESVAHQFCESAICSVFGTNFKTVNLSKRAGILSNMSKIERTQVGWSTNLYLAIDYLIKNKIYVDRIIVFSDMQTYGDSYDYQSKSCQKLLTEYRAKVNPDAWMHSIDLQGYGQTKFMGNKVNLIAGWSDKVLQFIKMTENMEGDLLDTVMNYEL
jgi:hypothetical protein